MSPGNKPPRASWTRDPSPRVKWHRRVTLPTPLTTEERDQLIREHAGLVKHIASRMAVLLPRHVDLEDLIHDGVLGLMDAINRFDPSRGIQFKTFASARIRGAILDALRSLDWVSRGGRRRARELRRVEEQLRHELGRDPSRDELGNRAGLTPEELDDRYAEATEDRVVSLDELRTLSEGASESPASRLQDPTVNVEREALMGQRKEIILEALRTLSEREQLVLSLYYFEDANIKEIAQILGVSEPRVSQIHSRCRQKLKERLADLQEDLAS